MKKALHLIISNPLYFAAASIAALLMLLGIIEEILQAIWFLLMACIGYLLYMDHVGKQIPAKANIIKEMVEGSIQKVQTAILKKIPFLNVFRKTGEASTPS